MATPDEQPPDDSEDEDATQELLGVLDGLGYKGMTEPGKQARLHAIAQLMTTDWADLETVEFAHHLLFPDVLRRRGSDGKWIEEKVMLRVPRDKDLRKCRVEARAWAQSEGIDEKRDRDLFVNLENMCILALCIRNTTPPHEPMHPDAELLEEHFDKVCLQQMWEKIERLNDVLNPAPNQLSSPEIVTLIVAIAKSRHLGPLVVYGPGAQTSFVVSMADLLLNLVGSKLSWELLERLMRESSPLSDSAVS
jgi:hypothetical protein